MINSKNNAFTLIELLIVIGVLAILATVSILVINPAQMIAQSRDARRLTELKGLNSALSLAEINNLSLGVGNTVYVSLPGPSNCSGLGLPDLPVGWFYACSTSANYKKVDGSGWIPVNFGLISSGSPFSVLPVDPVNAVAAGNYYTYVTGGSYELTAVLESDKQSVKAVNDGDAYPGVFSLRSSPAPLTPGIRDRGLVGYWKLDEASGAVASDSSGKNNNGNVIGAITWRSGSECVNQNCAETATGGSITIPYNSSLNLTTNVTYAHWIKIKTAIPASSWPYSLGNDSHRYISFRSAANGTSWIFEYGRNNPTCNGSSYTNTGSLAIGANTWRYIATTYDGSSIKTYLDGVLASNTNFSLGFCNNPSVSYNIAQGSASPGVYLVDEARIYSRALSAAEIAAIYNATK